MSSGHDKRQAHSMAQAMNSRARPEAALLAFLAASVALHAALLLSLPGAQERPQRVDPLEVKIVREEPPRPLPVLETAPPERRVEIPRKTLPREKPPEEKRVAPPPPLNEPAPELPPLAIPPTAAAPVFTVPPPEPRTATVETKPEPPPRKEPVEPARAAPAADPNAAEKPAAVNPPSFSAAYLRNPAPRYPLVARRSGEQGTVTLKVLVTRDGSPASVNVEKTSGSRSLDEAAIEAVKGWRFVPAKQGSQPVEAWVLVPIVFRLEGAS